ncbi:hypothetical protein TNCV_5038901 [Trichonephila clavipes]|nr:hypothetical protein TNCV_5038901 [Trichonephila clavipes]
MVKNAILVLQCSTRSQNFLSSSVPSSVIVNRLPNDPSNLQCPLLLNVSINMLNHSLAAVAEWSKYRIVAGHVTSSSPVPLKTRSLGDRCTLNLSRAQTRPTVDMVWQLEEGFQLRCRPRYMVQNYVAHRQNLLCS